MNSKLKIALVLGCVLVVSWWWFANRNPGSAGCVAPEPPQLGIPIDDFTLSLNGSRCGPEQESLVVPPGSDVIVEGSFQLVGDHELPGPLQFQFSSRNPYDGVVFVCGGGFVQGQTSGRHVKFDGTIRTSDIEVPTILTIYHRGTALAYGFATFARADEQ